MPYLILRLKNARPPPLLLEYGQGQPMTLTSKQSDRLARALDSLQIELPSWGFANTGTRFGKFLQPAAAGTIDEKLADAGMVHSVTGVCPSVALHVLWD